MDALTRQDDFIDIKVKASTLESLIRQHKLHVDELKCESPQSKRQLAKLLLSALIFPQPKPLRIT